METVANEKKARKPREVSAKTVAMRAQARAATLRALLERDTARRVQRDAGLTVAATVEQIRRGALFDPRDLFYTEGGVERYELNGPVVNGVAQWKKGDVRRAWCAGDLKPMHELTEAQAQAITSIEVVMKNATAGDGQIDRILKIRLAPREKYVELAARHHGMLLDRSETNVNVTVVGSKLDEARQRWATLAPGGVIETTAVPEPEGA